MRKLNILILFLVLSSCSVTNTSTSNKLDSIQFTDASVNEAFSFVYQTMENSPELKSLKSLYRLDSVAMQGNAESEKILHLLNWTHNRWKHNGSNTPSVSNTLTILKEAASGMKFRCVEYGVVLRSALACNGFKARTLGLKTKDVEVRSSGAGHVLTEVWSDLHQKWFLLDAQFNLVPTLNDIPLNGVEFQNAIAENKNFKLVDINGEVSAKRSRQYLRFITDYLFYFDFRFDQREIKYDSLFKVDDKIVLLLVPDEAKKPMKFQRKYDLNYAQYTHSLNDFYRKP